MKILIAPDSYKGSLSAYEVTKCIKKGILNANKDIEIIEMPLADGGEGTVEILVGNLGGKIVTKKVSGPLGKLVDATYGIINEKTAIIEMASAAGLTLIDEKDRNPLLTTTFGVGQLILDALDRGCREFIIGIGGSSTNDGGAGMATALGVKFLSLENEEIKCSGGNLDKILNIDIANLDKRINKSKFTVACDVNNTLCGKNGAAFVYAKQKGASDKDIKKLDENLFYYAQIIKKDLNKDILNIKGSGAAGGLGGGLVAFFSAELKSGFDIISEKLNLEKYIKESDYIITGEGKIDKQSLNGKVPVGVGNLAKKHNKKVIAIVGSIDENIGNLQKTGISSIFSIISRIVTLEEAMDDKVARKSIERLSEQIIYLIM